MFTNPYDTTPCASYNTGKIVLEIKKALLSHLDTNLPENLVKSPIGSTRDLFLVTSFHDNVPPFAHPLLIEEDGYKFIAIDIRPFTRLDRSGGWVVTSLSDLEFLLLRANLLKVWIEMGPIDLHTAGALPLTVYLRWLSENISRRLGLDPAAQLIVSVVSGYFYLSLFRENPEMDNNEKIKVATQISRASYVPADKCIEIVEQLGPMRDVHDYISNLIRVVDSVRLNKFNAGLLYTIISGGWFGANSKEILAIAVEHPPTFISLVYAALTDRSYHRSLFAKTVQLSDKNNAGKNFAYNLGRMPVH